MLQAYLPTKVQEAVPTLNDFLVKVQFEKYLTLANLVKAIGALGASYVTLKVVKILNERRRFAHIPGPETNGIFEFLVGNLPSNNQLEREGKLLVDYIKEWHDKYGPVIKIQVLDKMFLATVDPEAIKEILIVKNFPKSPVLQQAFIQPLGVRVTGHGLLTDPDNKSWREQRSVYNPGFHRNVLMNSVSEFNAKADILTERLRSLADGKTVVKLFNELNHTALDVIASIAFGIELDSINSPKDRELSHYITEILQITGELFGNPWIKYTPLVISRYFRLRKAANAVREVGKNKILERLNDKSNNNDHSDILAGIMKGSKTSKLEMEQMCDNFFTFFAAGQETTANTLAFCFLELGRNRALWENCRREVDAVLGSRSEVTPEDITKLKYIGGVFKEALRLYPPAPLVGRLITQEMTINGLKIPADVPIFLSPYASQRNESYFPNPLEFKPERFVKDGNSMDTAAPSYSYFPFSLGPRNCIGQNFAQMEGIVILAKVIQKLDFELAPNQSFRAFMDATLKPLDGTKVILSLRK